MKKKSVTTNTLCAGLPSAFNLFLRYAWNLAFNASPDYYYIRKLFEDASSASGFMNDGVFDWDLTGMECAGDQLCYPDDPLSLELSE